MKKGVKIFIIVLVCSFKAQNEKFKKVFEKNKCRI